MQLAYMLTVEPEYSLGLKPMKKGANHHDDEEEKKQPKKVTKKTSKSANKNDYSF